ncbi:MAG TPA: gluconate 2-dehydrogenase subunit 3 family protein [Nocardioidaceae bacterium]|jgi:hypothetical protein|nr:gluconate 2-dehydrogenase subunit 3 family protein [Nocardioidaceae bacterium]
MQARLPSSGQTPGDEPSRFPGFDVLDQAHAWDPVTAGIVLRRLAPMPALRFFGPELEAVARPMLDLLLDQREEPRVPVFEMIDQRLAELTTDGWRYEDMPEDPEAWAASLRALDEDAFTHHGRGFAECDDLERTALMQAIADLGSEKWHDMPASRVWSLWTRYACSAFYSHPWVWNEIGFPGPAYPRGYKHPGINSLEPFEVPDRHPVDPTEGQL